MSEKANFRALLPMIVFLVLFIGTGIALTAAGADMPFYQLSATVAIIPAIVLAILQGKDDLNKKIGVFLSGVGEINIIQQGAVPVPEDHTVWLHGKPPAAKPLMPRQKFCSGPCCFR